MSLKDRLKKIAKELSARHKYFHGPKGKIEDKYQELKQWKPEGKGGNFARMAGLGGVDLSWFLFCVGKFLLKDATNGLNTIFLDNKIIDKLKNEKENLNIKDTDSRFEQFFRKLKKSYPKTAARLHLWMVYGLFSLLTISGIKIATHGNNNKKQNQEIVAEDVVTRPTIYNPSDTSFSKDFVKDYWTEIVIGLLEFETWRDKPKLQSGESRYTYGPGLTWVYVNNKQYPCVGKYKDMATNFSEAEIWDQVKHHALYGGEVMDKIKRALIQYDITEISQNQLLGLFFAGYQMPSQINAIVKRLSLAENEEKSSIDAFIAGKEVRQKFRNGTNKRRWWCAMLYTGKISVKDFLIMDRDSFSKLELKNILKDGHFIYTANVIKDAKNKSNPKTESVETFISENEIYNNIIDTTYLKHDLQNKTYSFYMGVEKIKNKGNKQNIITNVHLKNKTDYIA